jgi:hypothetical protein
MSAIGGLADHHQPGVLERHSDVIPQHGRGVGARLLHRDPWVVFMLAASQHH